jgi:hypothetical protein
MDFGDFYHGTNMGGGFTQGLAVEGNVMAAWHYPM